ncbi:MAG: sugar phosphate isomerase/epimerase, partial [Planctomycetia bacterium]|nr:sugar phosphate isomerase/epimerase [Planctomycetia bacterium]
LAEAAKRAADAGVRLALEFDARASFPNNLQSAVALVEEVGSPALGLCLDWFHYSVGPSKPLDLGLLTPENLAHVQLSDVADVPREMASDGDRILPGEGSSPPHDLIARLRSIGYAGTPQPGAVAGAAATVRRDRHDGAAQAARHGGVNCTSKAVTVVLRILPQQVAAGLDVVDRPQPLLTSGGQNREVSGRRERIDDLVAEAGMRDPQRGVEPPQIDGDRVGPQRLAPQFHVLGKKRQRELPEAAVDRIAVPEERAVALGNCPPATAAAEQGDHVIDVAPVRPHVHHQRRLSGDPQGVGRHERCFDAVGLAVPEGHRHAPGGRPAAFGVPAQGIDEILYSFGGAQGRETGCEPFGSRRRSGLVPAGATGRWRATLCWHASMCPDFRMSDRARGSHSREGNG